MPECLYARKIVSMDTRLEEINTWLQNDLGINNYTIEPASADASFRRYFRVCANNDNNKKTTIIMDAPPDKEDCAPFIDITNRLLKSGVNAPEVKAYSAEKGFLMLSDLGNIMYLDKLTTENADDLYHTAIDSLIMMQTQTSASDLPEYNEALLQQEMDLFRDWLLEKHLGLSCDLDWLDPTFSFLARSALEQPQVFVHRDYHSRNLTWLPDQPPGILDFQDAVLGPISYDLVSLLRDCYVQWPQDRVVTWVKYYSDRVKQLPINISEFSEKDFIRWFDLMGVQRHLKASGIFTRLWYRDGKNGYLKDIPRTLNYIAEVSQKYPELKDLKDFLIQNILPAFNDKDINT